MGIHIGGPQVIPKSFKAFQIEHKNEVHKKGGHKCPQSNSITYILQMQVKIRAICFTLNVAHTGLVTRAAIFLTGFTAG
jgi:hypothetical protein